MEPWWKTKHDFWIEDFRFEYNQKKIFADMLIRHPDDKLGDGLRSLIKLIDRNIKTLKKEYKNIYGVNFNMNRVKNED